MNISLSSLGKIQALIALSAILFAGFVGAVAAAIQRDFSLSFAVITDWVLVLLLMVAAIGCSSLTLLVASGRARIWTAAVILIIVMVASIVSIHPSWVLIIGTSLFGVFLAFSIYDLRVRLENSLRISLRVLLTPLVTLMCTACFVYMGSVVYDRLQGDTYSADQISEIILSQPYVNSAYDIILDQYNISRSADRAIIKAQTSESLRKILRKGLSTLPLNVIAPILGILSALFILQTFRFIFVSASFAIASALFLSMRALGFVKIETAQKEAEMIVI